MDIASTAASWERIPYDVLYRVLSILSREHSWRQTASIFYLVNKHWRDAIRQSFVILNPRQGRPFNFFRDVNTFSQYPNLHTLVLKECSFQSAVEWVVREFKNSSMEMPSEVNLPIPEKLAEMKKLRNLKIEKPDELEPFLSVFCNACPLQCLYLKNACLTNGLMKKMKEMTTLKTLKFRSVDMVPNVSFVDFLKEMNQLEMVELSFADKIVVGSVTIFTRLRKLNYLRINLNNFDKKDLNGLTKLQHLRVLTLDGRVNGDSFDLSNLSEVIHLSINCPSMPLWIPKMTGLQCLGLQTSDDFKNTQRRAALMSIAPRLKVLQLIAANAADTFIRHVISKATDLEIIKLSGHTISGDSIKNLHNLKEFSIKARTFDHFDIVSICTVLGQLTGLESLTVSLKRTPITAIKYLLEPDCVTATLKKLTVHGVSTDSVTMIIQSLPQLEDLRLLNGDFKLDPFEIMAPSGLPVLRNLCLSNERPYSNQFDIRRLLGLPFVYRLSHLGFKKPYMDSLELEVVSSFRVRAPQVLIDEKVDWEPDEFQIPC